MALVSNCLFLSCLEAAPFSQFTCAATPTTASFGYTVDDVEVQLYTLRNAHGATATISSYGSMLTSLLMPDRNGQLGDVVPSFENVSGYQSSAFRQANPYFGALIGRYGNRIAEGKFTLDGKACRFAINNGSNALHGGTVGLDQRIWQAPPGTSAAGETLS